MIVSFSLKNSAGDTYDCSFTRFPDGMINIVLSKGTKLIAKTKESEATFKQLLVLISA